MRGWLLKLLERRPPGAGEVSAILERFPPPVLILGCHRSGTTLLAELLQSATGMFLGADKDENEESRFFIELNQWLLRLAGGNWDNGRPIAGLLSQASLIEATQLYLSTALINRGADKVTGGSKAWGWKDPRTVFTLPLWRLVFPEARLIVINRHGVDVAQSLCHREQIKLAKLVKALEDYRAPVASRRLRQQLQTSLMYAPRCAALEGAFDVWCEYTQALSDIPTEQVVCSLNYEDLVADPVGCVTKIADALSLEIDDASLQAAAVSCNADRVYAFRSDPELQSFAQKHQRSLEQYGYESVAEKPIPRGAR